MAIEPMEPKVFMSNVLKVPRKDKIAEMVDIQQKIVDRVKATKGEKSPEYDMTLRRLKSLQEQKSIIDKEK